MSQYASGLSSENYYHEVTERNFSRPIYGSQLGMRQEDMERSMWNHAKYDQV